MGDGGHKRSCAHTEPTCVVCAACVLVLLSWHTVANMLYVDQPVGTGLSFTTVDDYADDEAEVDAQFYLFLQNFLALHTSYAGKPLYFSGESHAGEQRVQCCGVWIVQLCSWATRSVCNSRGL